MLTWDYDRGIEIDDERGSNGFIRPDVNDAWIMAHALNDNRDTEENLRRDLAKMTRERNIATDHADTLKRVGLELMETLANHARTYSIEQELCGMYERFLSAGCGEVHSTFARSAQDANDEMWNYSRGSDEYSVARSSYLAHTFGKDMVETFVRNASRVREHVVTAPVVLTTRTLGRFAPDFGYNAEYAVQNLVEQGRASVSSVSADEAEIGEPTLLSYSDAQLANENFSRRGSYTRDTDY